MAGQYSQKARKRAAKPGSRIPSSVREDFLNSAPSISTPAGPITYRMSGWFPGKRVGGIPVPNPSAVAEVTSALAGLIPNPSIPPEDNNIHPIPSGNCSATDPVGIFTGVATPSALLGSGVSGQPLQCVPELHNPGYMSGMGDVCAAWPVVNDLELSPFIHDMKILDVIKATTPNTLAISQTLEAVALQEVPDNTSTTGVNTVAKNTQLQTSIHQPIPASVSARQNGISRSGSPIPLENSVKPSSPDAPLFGLELKECISELAASGGARTEEEQQRTPLPGTENRRPEYPTRAPLGVGEAEIRNISHINSDPIGPPEPPATGEKAGGNKDAIKRSLKGIAAISPTFGEDALQPPESDARPMYLEPVTQQPASIKHFLDGHQSHTPPPIDDAFTFASPTKDLPGAPKPNTAELGNKGSYSSGSARLWAVQGEKGTPDTMESSFEGNATIGAAMGGNSPPRSGALDVGVEAMIEETTPAEAPIDGNLPQAATDTTDSYQFPSEEQVLARARTAGTALFSRDNVNFDDLRDSYEEASISESTNGSKFHRPPSSTPPAPNLAPYKLAPRSIPLPETMVQWFFSSKIPAPKWAPLTLYFPGGRIVDPVDPDYRFFDQVALLPPRLPPSAYVRKTPLPPDNSQDARGLIPQKPKERGAPSIYDFIDKICPVRDVVDPQIAINAKSVGDFVKTYYIEGPGGAPLLKNPPRGAIPQAKIKHEWIPTSVLERYRIERVIKLLDLEISPATRAALFWVLIERQTERTRVLLKFFAEHPEPKLKDIEEKLIAWGYLPEMARGEEDITTNEPAPMDPKDMIRIGVLKETQQILDALREAAGNQKKLKFLLPFMEKYSARNLGFFGLMGSDKMIELVEELCNCLQAGEKGSDLPSFNVQMGCWSLLDDLRPSVFIARSAYLCDLEYLYVVTQRAEVDPDVLEMVARVMAPILKRISEHDDIPLRREIPVEVKQSLEQTGNAQIARYLEVQLPPVVIPTAQELAALKRARIERYEKEQARQEAIRLEKRQEVMKARVQYMEEDIPRDLAIRPAEIYSPSRRCRKLVEGKARISRPWKERAGIAGTVGHGEERETLGQTMIAPANTKLKVTRKRGREEALDEIAGPSKVVSSRTPTSTRPRSKRVCLTANTSTVEESPQSSLHKPSWNDYGSHSDALDSPSASDGSDEDRGRQKSRPKVVKKAILQADSGDQSGESEEDEELETRASISASKQGVEKSVAANKARAVSIPTQVSKPIPASATRAPSPVRRPTRGDLVAPSRILPDLDDGGDETDGEWPRKGPTRAQKGAKKGGDISDENATPKKMSTTAQPRVRTPSRPPVPQPLRRSPRKHQPKPVYESDSSSSDEGDNGDAYDPPQTYPNNKQNKVPKQAKRKGSRKNAIKAEKTAPPAQIPAGIVKTARGRKGKQPRLPIRRDKSGISDVGEDDKPLPPPPKVARPIRQRIAENESDISDEDETPKPIYTAAQPRVHTPSLSPVPQPPLGRSPREHQPKRTYESDSSSSDEDDSDDYYAPQTSRSTKRANISEEAGKQDIHQNVPRAGKPQQPAATLDAKAKPGAKSAAEKAQARSGAARKAAATRAANHQAFVDKVTTELEAEARRAADADGCQPGAVTEIQVKGRMKREKEKMKREKARERSEAAAAMREDSAEANQIATAMEQAAAAKKRAATIAAKKAAVGVKTQARSQSTVATKTTNAKIKREDGMDREIMAEALEEKGSTLKAFLNTTCPLKKKYTWMEGHDEDHEESPRAGERDAARSSYEAAKKGKRRRLDPKK